MSINKAINKIANIGKDMEWLKDLKFIRKWLGEQDLKELRKFVRNLEMENAALKKEIEELKGTKENVGN